MSFLDPVTVIVTNVAQGTFEYTCGTFRTANRSEMS
jgi:hypothetical protein